MIAIIGILAAIAIPQYNDYVARSQITAGFSEASSGRTFYEERLQRGVQNSTVADIGLSDPSTRCDSLTVNRYTSAGANASQADEAILCDVQGNPDATGVIIGIERSTAGAWSCVVKQNTASVDTDLLPDGCS